MVDYIASFCEEFQYPAEARQALLTTYAALVNNEDAYALFQRHIALYNQDKLVDYNPVWPSLDEAAEGSNVSKYTVYLLFYICISKHTRELYEKRKLSYEIFYDSMSDLKWKLFECHQMFEVWGNFVATWEVGFFELSRFALGRLQYETIPYHGTYAKDGYSIKPNDIVLNMHIPSCGRLLQEDCFNSYKKATEFYKEYFVGRPTVFVCDSWLLYPRHKEFLPENSNIIKFMDNFDIISSSIDEEKNDLWRIFYKENKNSINELPHNTSLQRSYANWLSQGHPIGTGQGVFLFDGEQIL